MKTHRIGSPSRILAVLLLAGVPSLFAADARENPFFQPSPLQYQAPEFGRIQDGDYAVIRKCDTADNGAIVVALIDQHEVTLKRLRRKGASIALEPANQAYETRIFGPDRVKVQGRLVGLIRRY